MEENQYGAEKNGEARKKTHVEQRRHQGSQKAEKER